MSVRKLEDNIVVQFGGSERGQDNAFASLRVVFADPNRDTILREQEDGYMEWLFKWIETYMKKESGEWCYQASSRVPSGFAADLEARGIRYTELPTGKLRVKGLPSAYVTAKNVLERAHAAGLDYSTAGKSALEKQLRTPQDAFTKATNAANTLTKVWGELTQAQRTAILETISPLED